MFPARIPLSNNEKASILAWLAKPEAKTLLKCLKAADDEFQIKFLEAVNKLPEKESFLPSADKYLSQAKAIRNAIAVLNDVSSENIELFKLEILQ